MIESALLLLIISYLDLFSKNGLVDYSSFDWDSLDYEDEEEEHLYDQIEGEELVDFMESTEYHAVFLNNVFNITKFMHPGGQHILEFIKGREVSRFILGVVGLE